MDNRKLQVKITHFNGFIDTFTICDYVFLQGVLFVYVNFKSYQAKIIIDRSHYRNVFIVSNNRNIKIF